MLVGRHWSSLCARHTDGPMTLICYHDGCAMSDCVNVGASVSHVYHVIMKVRRARESCMLVYVMQAACIDG